MLAPEAEGWSIACVKPGRTNDGIDLEFDAALGHDTVRSDLFDAFCDDSDVVLNQGF
jgi:hypothetical protein